jgi:membrane protease YdiL (CAAX protease family)
LFILPLLLTYEIGLVSLGGPDANALRQGADSAMRYYLASLGLKVVWAAPLIIFAVLMGWTCWRWADRPKEPLAASFGITIESAIFAALLWVLSYNFRQILDATGFPIKASIQFQTPAAGQLLTYIGVGIYEEFLFRLVLFTLLVMLFKVALLPSSFAKLLAAVAAALLFAAAHHIGDGGEKVVPITFLFRVVAGLFFTALYLFRGFGVAVGAHAGYDILVGVAVG